MMKFTFPTDRIRVITTVLDDKLPRRLVLWLDWLGIPLSNITPNIKIDMLAARNTSIRDLVLPVLDDFDLFLFVDGDVEPVTGDEQNGYAKINRMFYEQSDIVGCSHKVGTQDYPTEHWIEPTVIHTGLYYCRSRAFRKPGMQTGPWFKYTYSDDGGDLLTCECDYFRKKAIAAGCTVSHAGVCHHRNDGNWNKRSI